MGRGLIASSGVVLNVLINIVMVFGVQVSSGQSSKKSDQASKETLPRIPDTEGCLKDKKKFEELQAALSRSRGCELTDAVTCRDVMLGAAGVTTVGTGVKVIKRIRNPQYAACLVSIPRTQIELYAGILIPPAYACVNPQQYYQQRINIIRQELKQALEIQQREYERFYTGESNSHWSNDLKRLVDADRAMAKAKFDRNAFNSVTEQNSAITRASNAYTDLVGELERKYKGVNGWNQVRGAMGQAEESLGKIRSSLMELDRIESQVKFWPSNGVPNTGEFSKLLGEVRPGGSAGRQVISGELEAAGMSIGRAAGMAKPPINVFARNALKFGGGAAGGTLSVVAMAAEAHNKCAPESNQMSALVVDENEGCGVSTIVYVPGFDQTLDLPYEEFVKRMNPNFNGVCNYIQSHVKSRYAFRGTCQGNKLVGTFNGQQTEIQFQPDLSYSMTMTAKNGKVIYNPFKANSQPLLKTSSGLIPYYNDTEVTSGQAAFQDAVSCCANSGNLPTPGECSKLLTNYGGGSGAASDPNSQI